MTSYTYAKAVKAASIVTGTRFCSHCWMTQKTEGGQWKVSSNGRTRRWRCAECVQRAQNRAATAAATADPSTGTGSGASAGTNL